MHKQRPKYNLWQNTGYMLSAAWQVHKPVILICILAALVAVGKTTTEMLIAPVILSKVEETAPLPELVGVILAFGAALMLLWGAAEYLEDNKQPGRLEVRMHLSQRVSRKAAETSYPNTLDTAFLKKCEQADNACAGNVSATEAIWETWSSILTNLLGFGIYLALLSSLHPLLLGLVTVTTAAGFFVNNRIHEWGYRHRDEEAEYQKQLRYITRRTMERPLAKDIRIFGLRTWIEDVWDRACRLYRAFLIRRERVYLWTNVVDLALTLLRNGAAYFYLIRLTLREGLPASEFLLYFAAVSGFTAWVTGILDGFSTLHKQSLDLSILREFLEHPEPFRFADGKPLEKQPGHAYEIRLEDVSYRYPAAEKDTISHLNLTIRPGEKLAIVGLNGAGKTTLVKLVCGLLDPTEGRVLLDGQDIRQYNRWDYYALLSAVFQEYSVLEVTAAENVAQSQETLDLSRVRACLTEAGMLEKIQSLPKGLDTPIGRQVYEDGVELSGGQTQRLMLARALYKDGPILVLDEPTAALDPIAENDIYEKYNEMTAGRTSVFISHRLASTRFCDRILLIRDGAIAEEGTHESLLAAGGEYARLFEVQSRYYREGGGEYEEI